MNSLDPRSFCSATPPVSAPGSTCSSTAALPAGDAATRYRPPKGDPMKTTSRRPITVGNWKMNLGGRQGLDQARHLLSQVDASLPDHPQLVILPPFTALPMLQDLVSSSNKGVEYGAQDLSPHDDGAFTGDISGAMLVELGCRYVLVGHSERRDHHDENDW